MYLNALEGTVDARFIKRLVNDLAIFMSIHIPSELVSPNSEHQQDVKIHTKAVVDTLSIIRLNHLSTRAIQLSSP